MIIKDDHLALSLFFLLLIGFFIFFSGVPGTDDEQLFASAAQSHVITGRFSADQVYGNERLLGNYSGIAPLHVLFGSIIYRFASWIKTGGLQCFFLLSPLYSALTGYLLAKIAQRRGFSKKTILFAVLAFAFTTMVFAYSKTFFREPLAMLLITASFYEMDLAMHDESKPLRIVLRIIASIIILALAIWTKEFLIICFPMFIGYFIVCQKKIQSITFSIIKATFRKIKIIAIILFICVIACLAVFLFKDQTGRFSTSYFLRLLTFLPQLRHDFFLPSLWGAFFSVSKGFLIYSPILLLVVFSPLILKDNTNWADYFLALDSALGVAILQVFFYDDQWWTFTWSTRFMLPIIPLWIICLFPLVEWIQNKSKKTIKHFFIAFLLLCFILQLGSVLISSADFTQYLMDSFHLRLSETNITRLEMIPAFGHWLAFFHGIIPDVAWMRVVKKGYSSGLFIPLVLLIAGIFFFISINKTQSPTNHNRWLEVSFFFGVNLLLPFFILLANQSDPYYGGDQLAYRELAHALSQNVHKNDLILLDAYNQPIWYFYFNFGFPTTNWIGLPPANVSINSRMMLYTSMDKTMEYVLDERKPDSVLWLATEKREMVEEKNYSGELQRTGLLIENESVFFQTGQYPLVRLIRYGEG